jgi:ABC-type sugar transport system substrate-binding protein
MKNKGILLSFCLIFALVATGCGSTSNSPGSDQSGTPDTPTFKVGWSIDTITSPFNAAEDQAMKEGWAAYPEVELYSTDGQAQSIKQVSDIEDLVKKDIDILIVKPRDERTLVEPLKEVMAQGIPVILIDRYIEGEDYTTFIGSDNVEAGRSAGAQMAEKLNGKGNVVVIEATPGASNHMDRTEGFNEEISKYPDIKILASQPCTAKRDEGKKLTENWLQAYGKDGIDGIHCNTDEITMGVIQALEEAKVEGVVITSINGQMEVLPEISNGIVAMTSAYSTGVHPAIELSWAIMNGALDTKDIPKKIMIPIVTVGVEESEKYYDANTYLFDYIPGGSPAYLEAESRYPFLEKLERR